MKNKLICLLIIVISFCNFIAIGQIITNQYDNLGRLKKAEYPDSTSIVYTYDNGGNRIGKVNNVPCSLMPVPMIASLGITTFCAGDSVILTACHEENYLWSNGATTKTIKVTTSGDYSIGVKYSVNGCVRSSPSIHVTVHPLPTATITAMSTTTFCQGDSVILNAGSGVTNYKWSSGDTIQNITVSKSGNYSVMVTDSNGCQNTSPFKIVTVNPLPPKPAITASGPTTFCKGNSIILTSDISASYLWNTGSNAKSIWLDSAAKYFVRIYDVNGCSAISDTIKVKVNPLPLSAIMPGSATTFCQGDSVILTASNASSYSWSNGEATKSTKVTASGNYSVAVTDTNGCSATSQPVTVTVHPVPTVSANALGPVSFCQGDSVKLTAIGAGSYLWSTGSTFQTITVNSSGTYSVTITDANNCIAVSQPVTVIVNPLPTANIHTSDSTTFCQGQSITLTADSSNSYLWNTGQTTRSIIVSQSGNYGVTVANASGCSAVSSPVAITVNPLPIAPAITSAGPTVFCQGGSATLDAGNSYSSYLWSTGETTQKINLTNSGSYSVAVTNTYGCSITSATPVAIVVNPNPAIPAITANGATTFCQGGNVILTSDPSASYSWSTGEITQSIAVSSAGSYYVTITDGNGCSAISPTIAVTTYLTPTVTITHNGSQTFCFGDSLILNAGIGFANYLWNTGASTQAITVKNSGNYSVTVTDNNGCLATSSPISILVNPLPTVSLSPFNPNIICKGGNSIPLPNGLPVGGTYSGTGVNGTNFDPSLSIAGTNLITYSYTDINGCSDTASRIIYVDVCSGISNTSWNNLFIIYPNPSTGIFTLEIGNQKTGQVKVINILGEVIYQTTIHNSKSEINISNSSAGTYILQVLIEGKIYEKKLVVE